MNRFRHYVLPAWWWDSYGWRDRLELRWGAFRLGAFVKPDRQHFVGIDTEEPYVSGF